MKKKWLQKALLLSLLLSACANPPEGIYVSSGMKKELDTNQGSKIVEVVSYEEQETLIFQTDGSLTWSKIENGQKIQSKGKWERKRDVAGVTNIHASYKKDDNSITYILGQRKNDAGEEELHLKYFKLNNGPDKIVTPENNLSMTSFIKVKNE
jgi:hypothetical protein